jgi:transmembrane sensor
MGKWGRGVDRLPQQEAREARRLAAEWAVRLSDAPLNEQERHRLQAWLEQAPHHAEVLRFARQTWADLAGPAPARGSPSGRPVTGRRAAIWPSRRRGVRWLGAASLLVVLGSLAWTQWPALYWPLVADYMTATGEVRTLTLPDGSQATLDARSAIRLDYTAQSRHVELLAGSAIFQAVPVGEHEARPFVVEVAGGKAQALGTRFLVSRDASRHALVGVLQHRVAVSTAARRLVLDENQSAAYDADGRLDYLSLDLARLTSWQRGLLVFEQVPLQQVVDQLNRYRNGHILLGSQQLAQRRVNAVFRLDSLDSAVAALCRELQARSGELMGISLIY